MKFSVAIQLFAIIAIFSACSLENRVKTHPDPEVRIKAMQETLESLENNHENPEGNLKKKDEELNK